MLEEATPREARRRCGRGIRRDPRPLRNSGLIEGSKSSRDASSSTAACASRRWTSTPCSRDGRRSCSWTRSPTPTSPARAIRSATGCLRAARRRHQRDLRLQHPAPREPEGHGRAGHQRGDPRDRARHLPEAGRQVVNLDLAVEDLLDRLRAGKIYATRRSRRRSRTSSSRTTSRRCASWRCARWPRASAAPRSGRDASPPPSNGPPASG